MKTRENSTRLQILHIMAATLEHARPVLAAASSAGFRESGLQSLRCLDAAGEHRHQGADASPIVAVRSSGLFLESIIGYTCCPDDDEVDDSIAHDPVSPTAIHCLVTEEYLRLLVSIANERFTTNSERIGRFRTHLLSSFADISPGRTTATTLASDSSLTTTDAPAKSNGKGIKKTHWRQRRERKRAERLLLQEQQKSQHEEEIRRPNLEDEDGDDDIDGLIGGLISL
jgi:tRNA wybutosine-synthesizing protein 3